MSVLALVLAVAAAAFAMPSRAHAKSLAVAKASKPRADRGRTGTGTGQTAGAAVSADTGQTPDSDLVGKLSGKTVVVAGASGFLGSHLVGRLAAAGVDVHAISRTPPSDDPRGVRWWELDLTRPRAVNELFADVKPDIVFNLAGLSSGSADRELVRPMIRNNFLATVNLLDAAADAGCGRVLLAGSLTEPDAEAPAGSAYAAAKWASSGYARMYHAVHELPVVILRVYMTYGPGERNLNKLVPHTITSMLDGEAPNLSSGTHEMDWVYVDDVVDAYLAAAVAEGMEGKTLDIGTGCLHSVRDVVGKVRALMRTDTEPAFGARDDRPAEPVRVADPSEAREAIGWQPRTSLDEGLARTIAWYREHYDEGEIRS